MKKAGRSASGLASGEALASLAQMLLNSRNSLQTSR